MKKLVLLAVTFFLIISFFIIFPSCTDEIQSDLLTDPQNEKQSLQKETSDFTDKDPGDEFTDGFPCNIRIETQWEFNHYETAVGKRLILWPEPGANLIQYRTYWGFNSIIIGADPNNYNYIKNTCGFHPSFIIVSLTWSKTVSQIKDEITNLQSEIYYLDEPLDQYRFTKQEILSIANHISSLYPNSQFLLGSFNNPTGYYLPYVETFGNAYNYVLNNNSKVRMMCDKYYGDQRFMWDEFKNYYGSAKVFGHFIHSKRDHPNYDGSSSYDDLIGKANNLYIYNLSLFHGDDGWPNKTGEFCVYAYQRGWLRKFGRMVTRYYKCIEGDCATCSEGGTWILYNTVYGAIVEYN